MAGVEVAEHPDLQQLLVAKAFSDKGNYVAKNRYLSQLMRRDTDAFIIDSDDGKGIVGVTHKPTGFRIHMLKSHVDKDVLKYNNMSQQTKKAGAAGNGSKKKEKDPESLGTGFGSFLSDMIPFLPSGDRRAGAARIMAARIGDDPSMLVRHPGLTTLGGTAVGSLIGLAAQRYAGVGSAGTGGIAGLIATQLARRHELQGIQEDYDKKKRKRLREIDMDHLLEQGLNPLSGGSARLGAVGAYEAMRKRKYQDYGSLSEMGDPIALTTGALPLTSLIDTIAANKMQKAADFTDQKNNPTLPLYIAAGLVSALGAAGADKWFHSEMRDTKALDTDKWDGVVKSVGDLNPELFSAKGMNNAFFDKPRNVAEARGRLAYLDNLGAESLEPKMKTDIFSVIDRWRDGNTPAKRQKDRIARILEHGVIASDSSFGAPVIAHEAGHAKIESTPGILRALQRHVYPYSKLISPLSGIGSMAAGLASGSALKGALLGTGIGALTGIGTVGPEAGASWHAYQALKDTEHSGDVKEDLAAALSTYLAAGVLPSTVAGAMGGYISGKRKKKEEQENN